MCIFVEIVYLVGGPWKSNVVLVKFLKSGCNFCMNPGETRRISINGVIKYARGTEIVYN